MWCHFFHLQFVFQNSNNQHTIASTDADTGGYRCSATASGGTESDESSYLKLRIVGKGLLINDVISSEKADVGFEKQNLTRGRGGEGCKKAAGKKLTLWKKGP